MATNVLLPHATPEQRSWDVCVTTYEVVPLGRVSDVYVNSDVYTDMYVMYVLMH